jgi:DNA-binding CsgD family transcriptional regulator
MTTSFVGREHELAELEAGLESARSGVPQILLLEGRPGIGKTALLSAWIERITDARVCMVSANEFEVDLPFGVLTQLIASPSPTWRDPFAAGVDLLHFLGEQTTERPIALVIDDAHLADDSSLRAVTFALRRLRRDPVVAVLSVRTDQVGHLADGLRRLVEDRADQLSLAGLTETEVNDLAVSMGCGPLSRAAATRLRVHTAGSPLHLRALMTELPTEELQFTSGPLPAPRSFAMLVLSSLAVTSQSAQQVARAVSVLGDRSTLVEIAAVAELADAGPALEELHKARILRLYSGRDGWRVEWEHPLVGAAVYDDLGPTTRARLHRRAAEHLGSGRALAHLVAASTGPDEDLADQLDAHAAEQRLSGELRAAAEALLDAARLSHPGAGAQRRLLNAVELLLLAGDAATALAHSALVAEMPADGHRLHVQARLAWLSGRLEDAQSLAEQAWQRGDCDAGERGILATLLATLCLFRGEGAATVAWAARATGVTPEHASAMRGTAAMGLAVSGRAGEGLATLAQLPDDPVTISPERHTELLARGELRIWTDDLLAACADLQAVSPMANRDLSPDRLTALAHLADVEFRLGDWDNSLVHAEQVVSLAEDTEQVWHLGYVHAEPVLVLAARGQWQQAQAHVDAAREGAALFATEGTTAYAENAAVHLAMSQADPTKVLDHTAALLALQSTVPREPGLFTWPVHHVAALVALGRLDEAEDAMVAAATLARNRGVRSRLAALARVRGELAAARHEHAAAREAFEDALSVGEGHADALERATAHASYGRFLRRRGERRAAVEQLRIARESFVNLGARPFLERCDDELAAAGVTMPWQPQSAASKLTPQELAVARLVSSGRTNQEAATELVLSVKTIGYHLGNVYSKLGVHSRTQLQSHLRLGREG